MQPILRNLLVPFTVAVIALGLWQVGGPEQARREYRDDQRVNDLYALAGHLECLRRQTDGGDMQCSPTPADRDRFTGRPYTVTLSHVCANFEQPERMEHLYGTQIIDGCLEL